MGKILSINHVFGKADILLDDGLIRLFVKFRNGICSEIRVWKLPMKRSFWGMFRLNNLIWAYIKMKPNLFTVGMQRKEVFWKF